MSASDIPKAVPIVYAHSRSDAPRADWETLARHLENVARTCARFAEIFGFAELGRVAGLLHDIGKCSIEFQTYIGSDGEVARGPDHSTAGAIEARRLYDVGFGDILAYAIAGHHAGLPDFSTLRERLNKVPPIYDGWEAHVTDLPSAFPRDGSWRAGGPSGFSLSFLTRFLFSCLVDADRLETARFYGGEGADRVVGTPLATLRDRLAAHMAAKISVGHPVSSDGARARLADLRTSIRDAAVAKAGLAPGFFTLTVPTGGGKTLTSLSFALEHAVTKELRRIVYVIPFTSIIEQTAATFRAALGASSETPNDSDVLEHHATFDWDDALQKARLAEDGRGRAPLERLQRATENWDAPVVVTTAVQFFESLFASRTSACRKLHNLARSVIVLDEAQSLPLHVLQPCLAALDELVRNYGASVVICTATQPAWRAIDGVLREPGPGRTRKSLGLDIGEERELAPNPHELFTALKRVEIVHPPDPVTDDEVAARFAAQPRMLCIVNSRRHAKRLFDQIEGFEGAVHLSTWMCPRHRRLVLERARADLAANAPVRIVSTSLIEAGVDIDSPEVWRAVAGLDSLLQAAGRCNREFRQASGRVVIFTPSEDQAPHDLKQAWQAGRTVLRRHADPQTLDAIKTYFGELYFNQPNGAFDASTLEGERWPILPHIAEGADECRIPFASIATAFRLIEDRMKPVIVPWSSGAGDDEALTLLERVALMPTRADLRRLQQYTVSIPQRQRDTWLAQGVLKPVHPALGDAMLRFEDDALYDARSGLRVMEPERRGAESNVFGG